MRKPNMTAVADKMVNTTQRVSESKFARKLANSKIAQKINEIYEDYDYDDDSDFYSEKEENGWAKDEMITGLAPTLLAELGHQIPQYLYDVPDYEKASFGLMVLEPQAGDKDSSAVNDALSLATDYSFEWIAAHVERVKNVDGYYGHKMLSTIGKSMTYIGENIKEYPEKYKWKEYRVESGDENERSDEIYDLWIKDCLHHGLVLSKFYKYPNDRISKSLLWLGRYYLYMWLDD